jgi:hypothetical protein
MSWRVPRIWEGGDVWIIGGGPSLTKEFGIPDDVVKKVLEGSSDPSIYSPYMKALHDKHVIGINVSYMIGNWVDMVFFGDSGFYKTHMHGLAKFTGIKISCHHIVKDVPWIKYLPRDGKHGRGISSSPCLVSWNGNSGAAAISVAAHAGAKRIILLGFDMKLSEAKMQHWHDVYQRGKAVTEKRLMNLPFDRHLRCFANIAKDAKKMGIEIINCCPDSAIKEFPKFTLKQLLYDNT